MYLRFKWQKINAAVWDWGVTGGSYHAVAKIDSRPKPFALID